MVRAMREVTDPNILAQLNGAQEVTDPNLLAQLNGAKEPIGIVDNFVNSQQQRGRDLANIFQNPDNQTGGSRALQALGNVGGTVGDVGSLVIGAARNVNPLMNLAKIGYNQLPEDTRQGVENTIAAPINAYNQNLQTYNQANPEAGRNYQAIRDLSNILPLGTGMGRAAASAGLEEAGTALRNVASGTARGAISPIVPIVKEDIVPLAQRAREFDIPLRADQVAPSRVRNTIQKVSQELPFSGVDAFETAQKSSWNKAVANTLGEESLTPDSINNFITRNSNDFQSVLTGKQIPIDESILKNLEGAKLKKTADAKSAIDDYIADIKNNTKNGFISGDVLNSVRSTFLKDLTQKNGDVKQGLGEILDTLDTTIAKHLSPEELGTLSNARYQYRNFKTVEPLLEKSTDGEINPTQLINRVAASKYIKGSRKSLGDDDLVDLARIGKEFLPKKGGSDTFQKAALGAGIFGTGGLGALAMTNPVAAGTGAALAGTGLALNRGGQAINQSQALIDLALRSAKKTK